MSKSNNNNNKTIKNTKGARPAKNISITRLTNQEEMAIVSTDANGGTGVVVTDMLPAKLSLVSNVSSSFQEYRWVSISIDYQPYVATTSSGRFGIGFHTDYTDKTPAVGVIPYLQSGYSGRVSSPASIRVPVDNKWRPYTSLSNFTTIAPSDQLDYSAGQILFAVDGCDKVSSLVGTLRIKYTIELRYPIPSALQ
nr:MAG: coat protein [Hangzhou tombus-like virus 1]